MAKTEPTIAVEYDNPQNSNLYFAPLQRTIRGRFDVNRITENSGQLRSKFPQPIPGQRLEYDFASGEGFIVEPLHEERYAAIRERIEALGMSLPKEREAFACDAPTFQYWVRGLVASGDAKIVSGSVPATMEGIPRRRFHSAEQADPIDRLTAAIERQSEGQAKMMELLVTALNKLAK